MADHLREQITVAAIAAVTGLTTTGTRVYRDRDTDERPLQADEVPGLVVTDDGDPSEIVTLGVGRLLERTMTLSIAAHVKAASGYSSLLNQILKEIEVALAGASLGGAKWAKLAQVAAREASEAGETPAVRQVFAFEFFYVTAHNAPDVAF
jgi:hypothetical protein